MAFQIGSIGEYKESEEDFESYLERFEQWIIANTVHADKKVSAFLSTIGPDAYRLLKNLTAPTKPTTMGYKALVKELTDHYKPQKNVIAERFRFQRRSQQEGESVTSFIVALKQLSIHCDYAGHLDEALRDRFVCGLRSEAMQKRLLTERELKFKSACDIACTMEMASKNTTELSDKAKATSSEVCTVSSQRVKREQMRRANASGNPLDGSADVSTQCYRCGGKHAASNCRFKNEKCHNCSKTGHIARACRSRNKAMPTQYVEQDDATNESENELFGIWSVYTATDGNRGIDVQMHIEDSPVQMQLDTGAAVTLVSEKVYLQALSHLPLQPCNLTLATFTGDAIPLKGQVNVAVKYGSQSHTLPLVIVKGDRPALLGRNWLKKIRLNWTSIFAVEGKNDQRPEVAALLQQYESVFQEGPGAIRGFKAHIKIKPGAIPIFKKARSVPYALKVTVEKELDRLEAMGVISKVDNSEWASPLVVVPKADKSIRICGDYKVTINNSVEEETYPLPNTEDLFATLAGGKWFSKLDLSHAYQQLELSPESEKYLTVNTHRGLYRYHRLSYGVSSAPSIFQGVMDQVLQGLEGVTCFLDDILVTADTEQAHLLRLAEVLSRLEKFGIRAKSTKCQFMKNQVEYLGHLIDGEGLHPTEEKVTAIVNAPRPTNVTELRSFLGLLNYYGRFLKDLATLLQPLHALLKKDVPWEWTSACDAAFQQGKERLLGSTALEHYDTRKKVRLACDASPYGVGAVISHVLENGEEKPIAFASRTLTEAEKKYAQIEKEALAIIFGVRKFHKYLYGRKFILTTDHKPLLAILGPKSAIPTLAALRMQRWALILMAYTYDIEYRRSEDHGNADALSRLPRTQKDDTAAEQGIFYFSYVDELPVQAVEIAENTKKDPVLHKVLTYTLEGWPDEVQDSRLQPFFSRRSELSADHGCILWGLRVVIPPIYRERLLNDLHEGHQGICRMKGVARSCMWWPQIDNDIEVKAQKCIACDTTRKMPGVAPLHCWKWPARAWQRIHIDFAEKDKQHFLVVVDSHSKWLEVVHMTSTTASKTIEVLRGLFAAYGLPEECVSDNGPQFTSAEFQGFLKNNGVKQTLVPPYHPASNGAAERSVQTLKASLLKQVLSEGPAANKTPLQHQLANFLLMYRSTPHAVTGCTPAELFLKRQLRTRFSLLRPDRAKFMEAKQAKQKAYHDRPSSVLREFNEGDLVQVRNFREGKEKWKRATVAKRLGPVTYLIHDGVRERTVHIDHMLASRASGEVASGKATDTASDQDIVLPACGRNPPATAEPTGASNDEQDAHTSARPQVTTHTPAPVTPVPPVPVASPSTARTPPTMASTTAPEPRRYPQRCHTAPKRLDW